MFRRLIQRLPTRAQRWIIGGAVVVTHLALLGVLADSAWNDVRHLREARSMAHMTSTTRCVRGRVMVSERSWGETHVDVVCTYEVDGKPYRMSFPLPNFSTNDAAYARRLGEGIVESDVLVVHYNPADPWQAAFSNDPQYLNPALWLAGALAALAWIMRRTVKTAGAFRQWWILDQILERAEKQAVDATARAKPEANGDEEEHAAKPVLEIKGLSTRNHLPAQPPPGWSVPMASTEGRGAWMIETPGVLVVAQLVRTSRGRVALQVGLIPDDRRRLEDPQALALLRHFRAVDEFVEQTSRDDDLARESPWVRVFLATPRAASPETWGEVKQPRGMLN